MIIFWIATVALATGIGLWLILGPRMRGPVAAANPDLEVYRTQLAALDADLQRGVVGPEEAERARVEISRRILEADRTAAPLAERRGGILVPAILMSVALASAFALYLLLGAPGYPDLPMADRLARAEQFRAQRLSQEEAMAEATLPPPVQPEAEYAELISRLREAVADNPGDLTGQRLLARNEAALGDYAAAAAAQERVVELAGDTATATDFATLADIYILAAGGYVSPEADEALARALALDPANGTARFYTGLMWAQTGRPDRAFILWRDLLEDGPEEAPWIAPIRAQIDMLAHAAGVDYTPPPASDAAPGPDAADIAAAAEMNADERQEMIRGMVDRLSDRLATEGGPAEDWARLITALGVLGDTERAEAIWTEARTVFAEREDELATVRSAARQAGVAK